MRVSKLFGKTLREDPADAEVASHRLMLKAGMIHQAAAGIYSYLPLAWRSLRKIEQIIREEMDAAGGQEVRLSALQPRELWDASGRTEILGSELFQLEDRRDRPLVLAPTHEELLLTIVKANVHSYRDLPMILYQIQTKFRDEPRPRAGLMRVREFEMKDAYSFDIDEDGLDVGVPGDGGGISEDLRPLRARRNHGGGRQRRHRRKGLPRVRASGRCRRR